MSNTYLIPARYFTPNAEGQVKAWLIGRSTIGHDQYLHFYDCTLREGAVVIPEDEVESL